MKKFYPLSIAAAFGCGFFMPGLAQETPVAEAVFGGRARDFSVSINADATFAPTVTMYMATESANSVFYQSGTRLTGTSSDAIAVNDGWQVMPTLDESAGLGSTIDGLASHGPSKTLVFLHEGSMYQTTPTATTNDLIDGPGVQDAMIVGDVVLHVRNGMASGDLDLVRGSMDADGVYTEEDVLTFASSSVGDRPKLVLDEASNQLFVVFPRQEQIRVQTFGDDYDQISSTTSVSSLVDASPVDALVEWTAFDVAPDGRWYVMGNSSYELAGTGHDRQVAYSYDEGTTWDQFDLNAGGPPGGVFGPDIVFIEQEGSSQFSVICGDVVSHAYGIEGTWMSIGWDGSSGDTRANSGFVCTDPLLDQMVYFTSNQGVGYSMDAGATAQNLCDGMLAIQVNDIDMTADKQNAWVASKSGVRRVTDYLLPTKSWSDAIWPNLDGSPYQCMEILDDDAETVIAGNTRLHKLDASGGWTTVFDPTVGTYGSAFHYGTKFKTVEQSPTEGNLVMAGALQEGSLKGGLFVSTDGGNTFGQLALNATATPMQDEDVLDIEFVNEGGEEVAYIGLSHEDGGQGNVFRVTYDASTGGFTVAYNFHAADCDFIGPFSNSISDLQLSAGGDTLFAAGEDLTTGQAVLFFKEMDGASNWKLMDMASIPLSIYDGGITALAFGNNRIFIALEENIYYYDHGTGSWTLGYTYPEGTQINVMYYDELLVGTGTGLYAHDVFQSSLAQVEHPVSSALTMKAFPNPATDELHVVVGDEFKNGELSLMDMSGREVISSKMAGQNQQLDLSGQAPGMYVLRLLSEDRNVISSTRIMKQ